MATAVRIWDGPVVGTATSQNATNELRAADIRIAANITSLLADLQCGRIPPGSLIVADEGSIISTRLAALTEYAAGNACKLVLAGDQEQLAAVGGGGGAMMLLADRLGTSSSPSIVRASPSSLNGASHPAARDAPSARR